MRHQKHFGGISYFFYRCWYMIWYDTDGWYDDESGGGWECWHERECLFFFFLKKKKNREKDVGGLHWRCGQTGWWACTLYLSWHDQGDRYDWMWFMISETYDVYVCMLSSGWKGEWEMFDIKNYHQAVMSHKMGYMSELWCDRLDVL